VTTTDGSARNLWPGAIIAFFVVAITGLAAFIVFATRNQMELVRPDYYAEEIGFQRQLDRMNRTGPINAQVAITYDAERQRIRIALPPTHAGQTTSGHIRFYRPSDANLDQDVQLVVDNKGMQDVDAKELRAGLWKIRVYWKSNNEEYFFGQSVVIDRRRS
jgi:nitrogen fixation protein FixH